MKFHLVQADNFNHMLYLLNVYDTTHGSDNIYDIDGINFTFKVRLK